MRPEHEAWIRAHVEPSGPIERPHEAAFREVEAPACGPGDVLVRSRLAGVCRTDLEVLNGELDRRWVRYPCIPGHEWSGVVEAEIGRAHV